MFFYVHKMVSRVHEIMRNNPSNSYRKKSKEELQKKVHERYQNLLEEEKKNCKAF